jgi:hypothetical protein
MKQFININDMLALFALQGRAQNAFALDNTYNAIRKYKDAILAKISATIACSLIGPRNKRAAFNARHMKIAANAGRLIVRNFKPSAYQLGAIGYQLCGKTFS